MVMCILTMWNSVWADITDGLIGYWPLDEGSGTTTADTAPAGHGNDGTLVNGPVWTSGKFGGALNFDGVDDYVLCSERVGTGPGTYPEELMPSIFSVSCWLKLDNFAYFSAFVGNGMDTGADECGFFLYNWGWVGENEQDFGLAIRTESGMNYVETPNIYQTNTWYHLAAIYDGTNVNIYVDGLLAVGPENVGGPIRWISAASGNYPERFAIGVWLDPGYDLWIDGIIDEVGYWDRALTEGEIKKLAGRSKASEPSPADGAMYPDTWVNLSWVPGAYAVSHDVYFGDNFGDVNEGVGDTFRGNQPDTYFVAGFPGFPYPDGLVPGTTYYWRIDEVNDADPNSPWKGDVWSLTVPPKTAYNPYPADGAKFIDADVNLSWMAGFGAKLHTIYFGDNFDDVNNATGGAQQGATTYSPGTLELEKVYYWRVDEFDAFTTHKGDVWSFTTAGAGGGVKGEYYKGMDLRNLVLTRTDPQINFNWGSGEPDPLVGADSFSVRWTGEVEAAFTETYTFYTNSDDGVRLWIDGQQLVDNWTDHSATENRGTIDLVAGQTYSVLMEYYEAGGDAVVELRWSSSHTPKQFIPQVALSPPIKAGSPNPPNRSTDIKHTAILSWKPGDDAVSHQVYFGTDEDAVKNATTGSPEYKGSKALGSDSYDPGKLAWFTTYYWRVDEVNNVHPNSPWIGNIWSFTTADFLTVDDFEAYNDLDIEDPASNRIFNTWIDGYEQLTNGSTVGYLDPPFCEQTIVHSGRQSMPLFYDNSGPANYSEATLPLSDTRDWTEEGVKILTLWFYGDPANAAESMYVAVANATGPTAVMYHDNPDATMINAWTQWNINLEEFSNQGVVLTNVDSIAIGFGNRNNPQLGGSGFMYIDDIRLYRPATEQ